MILMYHNVVSTSAPNGHDLQAITVREPVFENHLRLLKRLFNIMPLSDYSAAIVSNCLPPRALSITLDDGTYETLECLKRVSTKLEVPVTLFLTTGQLDFGPLIPAAYINALCFDTSFEKIEHDGVQYSLRSRKDRLHSHGRLSGVLRQQQDQYAFVEGIKKNYPLGEDVFRSYMGVTTTQLRELIDFPLVEIAAHSHTHPLLSSLTPEQLRQELELPKRIIEDATGQAVHSMAYPSGDYDTRVIEAAKSAGYSQMYAVESRGVSRQIWEHPRCGIFSPSVVLLLAKIIFYKLKQWQKS